LNNMMLYVTDGEWNLKTASQVHEYLAGKWLVPKNIIISIPHNDTNAINQGEKEMAPN
jgi:hypothetical protein